MQEILPPKTFPNENELPLENIIFSKLSHVVLHGDEAPMHEESPDGVEVPLLAGVVQGQEGLLVQLVDVGAAIDQVLGHAEEPATARLVQHRLAILKQRG